MPTTDRPVESVGPYREVTASQLDQSYDLIGMNGNAVVVALRDTPSMMEIGTTGWTKYGHLDREEYNSDLKGQSGRKKYDHMRRSDGQVRATLRLIKTPVLAARWYMEPGDDKKQSEKIAKFVEDCFFKYMSASWPQVLIETLGMLDFGFYGFEKVFAEKVIKGERRIIWQKLAPRHPIDTYKFEYDPHGGPISVEMNARPDQAETYHIPMKKMLVFTFEKEGGDMEGISILRSAYKHWFYKENLYKIDAIQKERHGIGIPVIKLPPGFKASDAKLADEIGRNLRTNEKAHIVLPPNWEILMLKLEGQPVDALASADHHDLMIARNVLGQFINNMRGTTQEEQQTLFLKATRYIAEIVRDVFNKYAIPELVDYNFPKVENYPELKVRRIGDTVDWRAISFAIRNLVGAGIIIPDDPLEKWVRDEMDLPPADEASQRIIVAPQQAGTIPDGTPDARPGPGDATTDAAKQNQGVGSKIENRKPGAPPANAPRQSTAAGMRSARSPGGSGLGVDNSGK